MGGRLRSFDQTYSECEWNLEEIMLQVQPLSPNFIKDPKKRSSPRTKKFLSSKSREIKKNSSPQFGSMFGRNLGFIGAGSNFFRLIILTAYFQWRDRWNPVRGGAKISIGYNLYWIYLSVGYNLTCFICLFGYISSVTKFNN